MLKKSMDAGSLRQKAIASNVANIGTPGYRRREVVFEEKLQESLSDHTLRGKMTHPRHIPIGREKFEQITPELITDDSGELSSGVNNVDIDEEMATLAKNQIQFSATATLIARRFRGLKSAIKGRI